jgi:HD-like signal output (HDOD) protein
MNPLIDKIKRSARLVSLPDIYFRLLDLMSDDDFTMAEVALLVGRDPAMAARFLKVVNSPFYRRMATVETVSHAVGMLGAQQVHDLVLCASIIDAFDGIPAGGMSMNQYWQRSAYCAETPRQLARQWPELGNERMYLIGLLHDVGHLFMYLGIPKEVHEAAQRAEEQNCQVYLMERELLGFDYALVGGLMLKELGLPKGLRIPVAYHPEPSKANQYVQEAAVLHIAANIIRADLDVGRFGEGRLSVDPGVWDLLDIDENQCLVAGQTASAQFGEMAESIIY